jgi:amino acid transporter
VTTSIVVGAGAALALVVNLGQSAIFTALASLCIAMLYLAYLGVTGPLLVTLIQQARHRAVLTDGPPAQRDETGKPLFTLGRWAIPVAAAAVSYQVLAFINLAWPRQSVYDLTGHTWWLQWSAVLFIGLSLVAGFAVHQRLRGNFSLIPQARFRPRPAELAASEADLA